ncbi:MAG: carbamoyl-phosphate synthase large subunit [Dehalococcoidia bacterium]
MSSSRRAKPARVLILGSGPIVIGQAAEFDYAGTQACKAMREEGIESILVNSNPATIMTDEDVADRVYIEPLNVAVVSRIIERERPDALLPTLGGQTGLNLAVALADAGVLDEYDVRLIGTPLEAIRRAEDRQLFSDMLGKIGEPETESEAVSSWGQARTAGARLGLPLVIRPAYTLGGTGGGIAHDWQQFEQIVKAGLAASPITQVLVERSLLGWKEIEYEVVRDGAGNAITVCNMENFDPMGVHTGDSIVVAPSQTLSDKDYQMLRSSALKIIGELGIEGGCNVQFALAPHPTVLDWRRNGVERPPYTVIEVNPRVSRSSALASKATGYPIARVAAKIAAGRTLDEIPNKVTGRTTAAFEPALDYVVVKIPRWPFDKFAFGDRSLGTQMKATGEVMAIDRTFEAALQKAVRSLEISGRSLLWDGADETAEGYTQANDQRLWYLMRALRDGTTVDALAAESGIDPWFLYRLRNIVAMEARLRDEGLDRGLLRDAKRLGFGDAQIGALTGLSGEEVREMRLELGLRPVYKMVDTCAGEFEAVTPYFYSTYETENEALPQAGLKALVIGSGPIRIGQGIEFDYASVHAAWALQKAGYSALMANSNPETVSTDFDTSDRLYFEPLDEEGVRDILENEGLPPSIVQFGGQTAVNLAGPLSARSLPIIGSSAEAIDLTEDRARFEELMRRIGLPQPPGSAVLGVEDALRTAQRIGFPVLLRPSYVLGGQSMEIVQNETDLARYMERAGAAGLGSRPILIDKYLEGREVEVDAICDGEDVFIPGIMEHIERAGVHSGDSMAVYPPIHLTNSERDRVVDYTRRIGLALDARGLINIQFVVMPGDGSGSLVYVLEANPRASRTVPFLSKVTGVPIVELAVNIMLGKTLREQGWEGGLWPERDLVAIKAPVFSMAKLVGVDTHLGPEMKSTGEVMGVDRTFQAALAKALMAAGLMLPAQGSILLSVADHNKMEAVPIVRRLAGAGYRLYATEGTAALIRADGIAVETVHKIQSDEHPNVVEVITEGLVDGVINTPEGRLVATLRDGFQIRRAATEARIPCFTSIDTAAAAVEALVHGVATYTVAPLPEYREPRAASVPA